MVISGVVTLSEDVLYHSHCFFIFDDGEQKTVCHETLADFDRQYNGVGDTCQKMTLNDEMVSCV